MGGAPSPALTAGGCRLPVFSVTLECTQSNYKVQQHVCQPFCSSCCSALCTSRMAACLLPSKTSKMARSDSANFLM